MVKKKKKEYMETPSCDNCGSNKQKTIWDDLISWEHSGVFRIVKCEKCGLMYTSPRPVISEIGKYYPKESYWGRDVTKKIKQNLVTERKKAYNQLFSYILKYKKKGSILDVGAGTGIFLSYFKDQNWKVEGVELSKDAVKFAKSTFDIRIANGDFLDFNYPKNTFDVITLNNALEHLYSPRKTLTAMYPLLKKGGLIAITVPNVDSIGLKIFGKKWHALQPPRHLYHFLPSTLTSLLHSIGFQVIADNQWYFTHNFYTIFESFRFNMSPRFKKKSNGGLVSPAYKKTFSLKKEAGKILIRVVSFGIVVIGSLLGKCEVMTIYAYKK